MYRFEELLVWQRGLALCETLYRLTRDFPREEQFGLTSQLRRAAVSIPTNIAEGTGDVSDAEFIRFLRYALRSQHEVASLLRVSKKLDYVREEQFVSADRDVAEIGRLLQGLLKAIKSSDQLKEDQSAEIASDLEILYSPKGSDQFDRPAITDDGPRPAPNERPTTND